MKIAYFDCFSGISGDMILGALVDLGLPRKVLLEGLQKLSLHGYKIRISKQERMSIHGTRVEVLIEHHEHSHRSFLQIRSMIQESGLSDEDKSLSIRIFERLARAEAKMHNKAIDDVHFHEVGAVDSIVDIVGSAIGINRLGVERVIASELPLGRGFVKCHHGILPVPAPATLELLEGIPVRDSGIESELVTPTGAAIISTVATDFSAIPRMKIKGIGYGVGKKEFSERPNLLRILIGERDSAVYRTDIVIEANIDDMNPQLCDYILDRLFEEGALDVTFSPLQMKKNRPAIQLRVLCDPPHLRTMIDCIVKESTTIGLRYYEVQRYCLKRKIRKVKSPWGMVRVKVSADDSGKTINALPEYDDCKRIAKRSGVPLKEVYQKVLLTYLESHEQ